MGAELRLKSSKGYEEFSHSIGPLSKVYFSISSRAPHMRQVSGVKTKSYVLRVFCRVLFIVQSAEVHYCNIMTSSGSFLIICIQGLRVPKMLMPVRRGRYAYVM